MIGFSLDIDLSRPCFHVCRGTYPVYPATYELVVRRKIATEAARDRQREEGRNTGRVYSEAPGPYRLRAGVYLNLKLREIDLQRPRPWLLRVPSSFHPFLLLSSLSLSLSLSVSLFSLTKARRARDPSSSLSPLIPGSCRSSPRPARPSKNSLTCLADSSLPPYLSSSWLAVSFLYNPVLERVARKGNEETRRLDGSHRFSLLSFPLHTRDTTPVRAVGCCLPLERTSRVASVPSCTF